MDLRSLKMIVGILALIGVVVAGAYALRGKSDGAEEWQRHDAKLAALDQMMKGLAQQINARGGQGGCSDDGDCRALGLGPQTCGGYPTFLIYSAKDADEAELLPLVRQFNQASTDYNGLSMNVPHCGRKTPALRCEMGKCISLAQ